MRLPFAVPRFEPLVRIGPFLRVVRPSVLKKFAAPSVTKDPKPRLDLDRVVSEKLSGSCSAFYPLLVPRFSHG
jgi:hypothetical protein